MTSGETEKKQDYFVLVTCAVFEPGFRGGGPIKSVAQIVDTSDSHVRIELVTKDRDLGQRDPYPGISGRTVRRNHAIVHYLNVWNMRQWLLLLTKLRKTRFDLLYLNSLFEPHFTAIPLVAASTGLIRTNRILLAPRGELSSGALRIRSTKKLVYLYMLRHWLRGNRISWQASGSQELLDIHEHFPSARVYTVPDQHGLPKHAMPLTQDSEDVARFVFISRISPKKNLLEIIRSLNKVRHKVLLDIYGPIEDEVYWQACLKTIETLNLNRLVSYKGELKPDEVRGTFARYDAFVFPTLGENFGHVIAESLSASCPVICTTATPWTEVLLNGGGWILESGTGQNISAAVDDVAKMTSDERMCARARAGDAYARWVTSTTEKNILNAMSQSASEDWYAR